MANNAQDMAQSLRKIGVGTAYGEPIEIEGQTLIPVACGAFGFGIGESDGDGETEAAQSGGGGGGWSVPVGAYLSEDGRVRFVPNIIALLGVGIPFVWVAGRALARVIRALKR